MVYRLEKVRHIHTGRFGTTMLIRNSGRLSLMKTIDISRLGTLARNEDVLGDVRALSLLRHPNVLEIQSAFFEGGMVCIVSEYVSGGDVAGVIERHVKSGVAIEKWQASQWLIQGTLGICYLHHCGVVHRDLRSRRLLLSFEGNVVVSGIAISKRLEHSLRTEEPEVEAALFTAPEILTGEVAHSNLTDMWALGVILFHILTLKTPWIHTHPRALAEVIISAKLPPPLLFRVGSTDLADVCARLLSRTPSKRPKASEVLTEKISQECLLELVAKGPNPTPLMWGRSAKQVYTPVVPCVALDAGKANVKQVQMEPRATILPLKRDRIKENPGSPKQVKQVTCDAFAEKVVGEMISEMLEESMDVLDMTGFPRM